MSVENFKELKEQYLLDIKACVEMDEVPDELIINWDQTGILYLRGQWKRKDRRG